MEGDITAVPVNLKISSFSVNLAKFYLVIVFLRAIIYISKY